MSIRTAYRIYKLYKLCKEVLTLHENNDIVGSYSKYIIKIDE